MKAEVKTSKALIEEFPAYVTMPLVSMEEQMNIVARYQQGESGAEQQLKDANMRFVASVAKRYLGKGLTKDELLAAGTEGLLLAGKNFDPDRGFKLISYLVWHIRQYIVQALQSA